MVRTLLIVFVIAVLGVEVVVAQPTPPLRSYRRAKVSFEDFKSLVAQVEPHRADRLISLDTFLEMSKHTGTIILDTRSDFRFERIHIKGARHLSFTDFTQAALAKVIPSPDTRILIYCNNNFDGNQTDFASKIALSPASTVTLPKVAPGGEGATSVASQLVGQAKPLMMALNVPTYINLFGYGYRNVFELDELVRVDDPRIEFDGTIVTR